MSPVDLSDAAIEAVARRVADLLADGGHRDHYLVDAAEIARRFDVSRDTVYDRAEEWGAVRIGNGPKARLRFDPELVAERLGTEKPAVAHRRKTALRRATTAVDLLPIRGRS